MKQALYIILAIASVPIFAILVALTVVFFVAPADGLTFYEILSSWQMVLRFFLAILSFSVSLCLYSWFILAPILAKSDLI